MGVLFIFILISGLIISGLLFFNKGEKAQEIKGVLKDLYKNLKDLVSNLKKLFFILKELIQSQLDKQTTQNNDLSTSSDSSTPEIQEDVVLPTNEIDPSSDSSNLDSNNEDKTE